MKSFTSSPFLSAAAYSCVPETNNLMGNPGKGSVATGVGEAGLEASSTTNSGVLEGETAAANNHCPLSVMALVGRGNEPTCAADAGFATFTTYKDASVPT